MEDKINLEIWVFIGEVLLANNTFNMPKEDLDKELKYWKFMLQNYKTTININRKDEEYQIEVFL